MAFIDVAALFESRRKMRLGRIAALFICLTGAPVAAQAVGAEAPKRAPLAEITDSNSLLGSYLAAWIARRSRDSESAALYYRRALARDPANQDLLDDAFQLELASGNFDTAKQLAERLVRRQKDNAIAHIFLGLDAFKHKDYAKAGEHFKVAEKGSAGEPTIKLARAWVSVAEGHADKAVSALETPNKAAWATHFETVQRAFIADVGKRKAAAEQAYVAVYEKKPPNVRIAEAYARHLAFWGDKDRALHVLAESGADAQPMGKAVLAELQAGKTPKLMVSNVDEGLAEVFLGIGQVLATNNGVDAAQVYLRLALFLNPASDIAQLELAELYGGLEQYDKSIAILSKVRDSSPFWLSSQIRKALDLNSLQKTDEAIALVQGVLQSHPDNEQAIQTIASIESARKHYDAAIPYYDKAIALIGAPEKKNWGLFYARGIAFERTKQWDKAEPDFKKALELSPDEAMVLNYLGYSWLDQNINVPEAFDLIKKAVQLRPNDGYIVDSLGWGYYVQKNYEEAVKNLDRAVELKPEDPTLNDHLGDVYWRLGRKLEAKYQWAQALTLNPEPDDAAKIKKKLDDGIPDDESAPKEPEQRPAADAAPALGTNGEGGTAQ